MTILKPSHEGGALHRSFFLAVLLLGSCVQATTHPSPNKNILDGTLSRPASDETEKKSSSDTLFSTRFSSTMDETVPNLLHTDKSSNLIEKNTSPEDLFLDELVHPPFLKEKGSSFDDADDISSSTYFHRESKVSTDSFTELSDNAVSSSRTQEVSDEAFVFKKGHVGSSSKEAKMERSVSSSSFLSKPVSFWLFTDRTNFKYICVLFCFIALSNFIYFFGQIDA